MKKFKQIAKYISGTLVGIAIAIYAFHYAYTTTNESAFLGMDKSGRQIFIQTMDHYAKSIDSSVSVTSEWEDYSLLQRFWQEPMRTTLRIHKTTTDGNGQSQTPPDLALLFPSGDIEKILEAPYKEFLQSYTSKISMSENYSITPQELEDLANKAKVVTLRDLLRGFGFKKYEYYLNGQTESTAVLNSNITNHTEGNFVSSVGSTENEPLAK